MTAASDQGLIDIHDCQSLVLVPEAAREWVKRDTREKEATEKAAGGSVSADHCTWHPVSSAVGNVKNQGSELIDEIA